MCERALETTFFCFLSSKNELTAGEYRELFIHSIRRRDFLSAAHSAAVGWQQNISAVNLACGLWECGEGSFSILSRGCFMELHLLLDFRFFVFCFQKALFCGHYFTACLIVFNEKALRLSLDLEMQLNSNKNQVHQQNDRKTDSRSGNLKNFQFLVGHSSFIFLNSGFRFFKWMNIGHVRTWVIIFSILSKKKLGYARSPSMRIILRFWESIVTIQKNKKTGGIKLHPNLDWKYVACFEVLTPPTYRLFYFHIYFVLFLISN